MLDDNQRRRFDEVDTMNDPLSAEQLQTSLSKLRIGERIGFATIYAAEHLLRTAFTREPIDRIGDLDVSEAGFNELAVLLRGRHLKQGRIELRDAVCPALFVTTMVFCARYSHLNARNFWLPFSESVWGIKQAQADAHRLPLMRFFQSSRAYLTERYGFEFPIHTEGSVVRPVYHQAVLPFYIKDDFARLIIGNLQFFQETAGLFNSVPEPMLKNTVAGLRTFLTHEETQETALDLINNLTSAISLVQQGETTAAVRALMTNPIEREIWREIETELEKKPIRVPTAAPKMRDSTAKVEWVWELNSGELMLRVRGFMGLHPRREPDVCVWTAPKSDPDEDIPDRQTHSLMRSDRLNDEFLMCGGPTDGMIYIRDDDGETLLSQKVPPLPNQPITLFRITQQGVYALPYEGRSRIIGGDWIFVSKAPIEVIDDAEKPIPFQSSCNVPEQMARLGYSHAARYTLRPPITIRSVDAKSATWSINLAGYRMGQPSIDGENRVDGLSRSVPPAFLSREVWLVLPDFREKPHTITLIVRGAAKSASTLIRLDQIEQRTRCTRIDDHTWHIDLSPFLSDQPQTYQVSLRKDLQPLLPVPLEFTVLAPITILESPQAEVVYSTEHLPSFRLQGVSADQVTVIGQHRDSIQGQGEHVTVQWQDVRSDHCDVILTLEERNIRLSWDIHRVTAWVEGSRSDQTLEPDDLAQAKMFIFGSRSARVRFTTDRGETRDEFLTAQGRYERVLGQSSLKDFLNEIKRASVPLSVMVDGLTIPLFTYIRLPRIHTVQMSHQPDQKAVRIKVDASPNYIGNFQFGLIPQHDPLLPSITLGETSTLVGDHAFSAEIPSGEYQLHITLDGRISLDFADSMRLLRIAPQQQALSKPALGGDDTDPLTMLSHTVMLVSEGMSPSLSNLVRRLAFVQNRKAWLSANGYPPGWAITGTWLRFTTQKHRRILEVYPEVAASFATSGIGFTYLEVDRETIIKAHVEWEPQIRPWARVFVRIPTQEIQDAYASLDIDDLWPAYECVYCGALVGSRAGLNRMSPRTRIEHRHAGWIPPRNIVHDHALLATLEFDTDQFGYQPIIGMAFDPNALILATQESIQGSVGPLSLEAHLAATAEWLYRYTTDASSTALIDQLVNHATWTSHFRQVQSQFARYIEHSVPGVSALARFSTALEKTSETAEPLFRLNLHIYLLAALIRLRAYSTPKRIENPFTDAELRTLIQYTLTACPMLFEWALTWVELSLMHAVN